MSILGIILLFGLMFFLFQGAWTILELVIAVLVWALVGYLAGRITRGRGFGFLGNVAIGMLGAVVGNFLAYALRLWSLASIPLVGGILVGVLGAVVVLFVVSIAVGRRA